MLKPISVFWIVAASNFQYSIIGLVFTHILSACTSVCAGWGWCWRVWLLVVTELYLLLSGSDTEDGGGSLAPPRPSSPGIMQPHRPGHRTVRTVRSGALHPPPGPCTPSRALHPGQSGAGPGAAAALSPAPPQCTLPVCPQHQRNSNLPEKNGKEAPIQVTIWSTIYSFLLIFLAMIDRTLTTWVTHFSKLSNPPNRSFLPILL